MPQSKTFHLPRLERHPLILLLSLGLAFGLGRAVSVINIAISMGGPMALGGFFINFLGLVVGPISLLGLYLLLRKSPKLFGSYMLIAAAVAAAFVFWQFWDYPTVNGAFYMLRGDQDEFAYIPPEPSDHVLAVFTSSMLFYAGFEYLLFANSSFFRDSIVGQVITLAVAFMALSLVLMTYPSFSIEPKFAYLVLPVSFGLIALALQRFNSLAVLLGVLAVNFGLLFLLGLLAYYWFVVAN